MSNLTHLFKVGQKVRTLWEGDFGLPSTWHNGTVKETYADHIIIDVEGISNHCWYEEGLNLDTVYPIYNF